MSTTPTAERDTESALWSSAEHCECMPGHVRGNIDRVTGESEKYLANRGTIVV